MPSYEELRKQIRRLQDEGQLSLRLTDAQKADWAYGNAVISNPDVTFEMAERAVAKLREVLEQQRQLEARSRLLAEVGVHDITQAELDAARAERGVAESNRTMSLAQWEGALGVVSLGGDALEDCDRLYDDDEREREKPDEP